MEFKVRYGRTVPLAKYEVAEIMLEMSFDSSLIKPDEAFQTVKAYVESWITQELEKLKPTVEKTQPPDIETSFPFTGDMRPVIWLKKRLQSEKDAGTLDYTYEEREDAADVKIWIAGKNAEKINRKALVESWIKWVKNRLMEKEKKEEKETEA